MLVPATAVAGPLLVTWTSADGVRVTVLVAVLLPGTGSLAPAGTATPSFTPDVAGDYVATLVVNSDSSMTDTVTVHVSLPFADAGDDRFVTFRTTLDDYVELDGTASVGADKWTWAWDGSSVATPTLLHADTGTPEFVPTVSGDYILTLTVNEGEGIYEHTDTVKISVTVQ